MAQAKYRPSMTAAQIAKIVSLCKQEQPMSLESMTIVGILAPFQAKIENSAMKASYTTVDKPSLMEQLGAAAPAPDSYTFQGEVFSRKEVYWLACYNYYCEHRELMSLVEIVAAKEHMYLNDLMSPEEATAFEQGEPKL